MMTTEENQLPNPDLTAKISRRTSHPDAGKMTLSESLMHVQNGMGRRVVLFSSPFYLNYYSEQFPSIRFATMR
jgi:peptide subunit release factor RF-3